jgi:DNA-binding IscR family transcriptional regulator
LDIYSALEGEDADLFSLQSLHPNPGCRVGSIVQETLEVFFGEAENAMKKRLGEVSVAQMVADVMRKAGDCPDKATEANSASS